MKTNHTVWRAGCVVLMLALLGGCSSLLLPPPPPADNVYLLEAGQAAPAAGDAAARREVVLAVGMPQARSGYDTAQMVWLRQPHKLEAYARNRWADTPAHMLAPLLAQALEHSGRFQAVVQAPAGVAAGLRLDSELIRLQQDFGVKPSRIELALRVQLVDVATRRVVASAEFAESETAPSDDAYGGVLAANRALERLLGRVVAFCAEHTPAN